MKYAAFIPVFIMILMVACKPGKEKKLITDEQFIYPQMSLQEQSYLFENIEGIDYIFNELPFSLSQTDKPSIQTNIAGIGRDGVTEINCKVLGRIFYQFKGEIILEADIYFKPPDCHFYIFFEDGSPIYANQMTPENVNFFNGFLKQMNATEYIQ